MPLVRNIGWSDGIWVGPCLVWIERLGDLIYWDIMGNAEHLNSGQRLEVSYIVKRHGLWRVDLDLWQIHEMIWGDNLDGGLVRAPLISQGLSSVHNH